MYSVRNNLGYDNLNRVDLNYQSEDLDDRIRIRDRCLKVLFVDRVHDTFHMEVGHGHLLK